MGWACSGRPPARCSPSSCCIRRATGRRCWPLASWPRSWPTKSSRRRRSPTPYPGLLYFVKFAAGLAGVWLMHVTIRHGPISFARLHHVLGFAASAAVSTLACALVAVSVRSGVIAANLDFWLNVQCWWIGDFLGAADRHAADADHRIPRSLGDHAHARRPGGYLLGLRGAVAAARRRVPAAARDHRLAAGRSLHRLPGPGVDRHARRSAPHGGRRRHHRGNGGAGHHARTRSLRGHLPVADLPGAVRAAGAAAAGRDGRARRCHRQRAQQRRALSRLRRQQLRSDFPHRTRRAHAHHAVAGRAGRLGAQARLRCRMQCSVHGGAGRQGCRAAHGGHAARRSSNLVARLHRAHPRGHPQQLPGRATSSTWCTGHMAWIGCC